MHRQINMRFVPIFILIVFTFTVVTSNAQNDSATKVNNGKEILLDTLKPKKDSATVKLGRKDSAIEKHHDPHKATIRSAIVPGWGQAYNHEYWKIPIVYGALAVPASLFAYNNTWYQRTKNAYNILVNGGDTNKIYTALKGVPAENLQLYRNNFRKDRDYSTLFFLLIWGLNVVDATVFAHLKEFNVSDDLSLRVEPDFNTDTKSPSLSFALSLKNKSAKMLPSSF